MADHVIHGTGKPRFGIPSGTFWTGTNSAATATTITLNNAGVSDLLDGLNSQYGVKNMLVWSLTSDSPPQDTHGKVTAYNNATDVLTVDSWSNGTPDNPVATYLQHKRIDLPYCQRLTEIWTPDFIVKKMLDGDIKVKKRGFYYSASLDYAKYLHKDEVESLRDLFAKTFL
jgi:hypothetical protein